MATASEAHVAISVATNPASWFTVLTIVVAERSAHAGDFVGGNLLALAGAAEHNAAVGRSSGHRASHGQADRRIVDGRLTVGPVIGNRVSEPRQRLLEVFLQRKAGVVGTDRNSHIADCTVRFQLSAES